MLKGLHHIAILASNRAETLAFYEALGFVVTENHVRPERKDEIIFMEQAGVVLEDYMVDEAPMELGYDALDSLADALLALKERERDLIVLHYYTGHTLKEVAEMMGMSYINAKVIHKKSLESLRAFFAAR